MPGKCSALPWSTRNFELCRWAGSWLFGLEQNQRTVALTALWVSIGPNLMAIVILYLLYFPIEMGYLMGILHFGTNPLIIDNHQTTVCPHDIPRSDAPFFCLRFDGRDTIATEPQFPKSGARCCRQRPMQHQFWQPKWVCLKMLCTPKANGFADHYPY